MSLPEDAIAIIKSTAPILAVHGITITSTFYATLFNDHPEVRQFFNLSHHKHVHDLFEGLEEKKQANAKVVGAQPRALAEAIYSFASHVDNLGAMTAAIQRMSHKHVSLGVLPEHYPLVGEYLLKAIKHVLQDAATDEIMDAWKKGYDFLANILIQTEKGLYETNEKKEGGWSGYKAFTVDKKVIESQDVASFILSPLEGGRVPTFLPGQYLSFRLELPDWDITCRNYSISDVHVAGEEDRYRVSIKKMEGGKASTYFHEHIFAGSVLQVSAPCGHFTIGPDVSGPVVLLSAGIGVTPILTMLKDMAAHRPNQMVYFIHGARNGAQHSFANEVKKVVHGSTTIHSTICFSQPQEGVDIKGEHYDVPGRIDIKVIQHALSQHHIKPAQCSYYFCGPSSFMADIRALLRWLSVPDTQVSFDCFGPFESGVEEAGSECLA